MRKVQRNPPPCDAFTFAHGEVAERSHHSDRQGDHGRQCERDARPEPHTLGEGVDALKPAAPGPPKQLLRHVGRHRETQDQPKKQKRAVHYLLQMQVTWDTGHLRRI
jgi:hypothetical protein